MHTSINPERYAQVQRRYQIRMQLWAMGAVLALLAGFAAASLTAQSPVALAIVMLVQVVYAIWYVLRYVREARNLPHEPPPYDQDDIVGDLPTEVQSLLRSFTPRPALRVLWRRNAQAGAGYVHSGRRLRSCIEIPAHWITCEALDISVIVVHELYHVHHTHSISPLLDSALTYGRSAQSVARTMTCVAYVTMLVAVCAKMFGGGDSVYLLPEISVSIALIACGYLSAAWCLRRRSRADETLADLHAASHLGVERVGLWCRTHRRTHATWACLHATHPCMRAILGTLKHVEADAK